MRIDSTWQRTGLDYLHYWSLNVDLLTEYVFTKLTNTKEMRQSYILH